MPVSTIPSSQEQNNSHRVSYQRFRRRITRRSSSECPAASTPLTTGGQCEPSFEFDTVCQRLVLDSPQPQHKVLRGNLQETAKTDVSTCIAAAPTVRTVTSHLAKENAPQQGWVWRDAVKEQGISQQAGKASDDKLHDLQPFAVLEKASVNLQVKAVIKMAAPTLMNDYCKNGFKSALFSSKKLFLSFSVLRMLLNLMQRQTQQKGRTVSLAFVLNYVVCDTVSFTKYSCM
nr:uncharacterized protein LOC114920462 [Labrus bergylta]